MAWFSTFSTDLESTSSQYWSITDGSQTGLDITGNLTFSAWVKFESFPAVNNGMTILSKFADTANQKSYNFTLITTAGPIYTLSLVVSSDGTTQETLGKAYAFSTGTWYHIAVKWTASTSTAEFFVNGASQGTSTGAMTAIFNSTAPFAIGTWFYSGAGGGAFELFDGLVDDVRVWSRVLSNTEIGNIFSNPIAFSNGANLQGWWKFDNDALDETANNNDLTGSGSPVFSSDIPFHRCEVSDVAGTPADTLDSIYYSIIKNEVVGTPVEAHNVSYGWSNSSKSNISWNNQNKSTSP